MKTGREIIEKLRKEKSQESLEKWVDDTIAYLENLSEKMYEESVLVKPTNILTVDSGLEYLIKHPKTIDWLKRNNFQLYIPPIIGFNTFVELRCKMY